MNFIKNTPYAILVLTGIFGLGYLINDYKKCQKEIIQYEADLIKFQMIKIQKRMIKKFFFYKKRGQLIKKQILIYKLQDQHTVYAQQDDQAVVEQVQQHFYKKDLKIFSIMQLKCHHLMITFLVKIKKQYKNQQNRKEINLQQRKLFQCKIYLIIQKELTNHNFRKNLNHWLQQEIKTTMQLYIWLPMLNNFNKTFIITIISSIKIQKQKKLQKLINQYKKFGLAIQIISQLKIVDEYLKKKFKQFIRLFKKQQEWNKQIFVGLNIHQNQYPSQIICILIKSKQQIFFQLIIIQKIKQPELEQDKLKMEQNNITQQRLENLKTNRMFNLQKGLFLFLSFIIWLIKLRIKLKFQKEKDFVLLMKISKNQYQERLMQVDLFESQQLGILRLNQNEQIQIYKFPSWIKIDSSIDNNSKYDSFNLAEFKNP
ncbi:unnamed protein product [Paramecium sonneborni]|uniref:Transmembrane protein n=1 Tax=Paramecium sonneborni TaxID=65129 RepID=A0A8S1KVP7_9CILI|nr:unnamed protein product [Paramecium sonneborni]